MEIIIRLFTLVTIIAFIGCATSGGGASSSSTSGALSDADYKRMGITKGGPGKVDLLEEIDRSGSISKAARKLGLSYRRAWILVDTMNKSFSVSLVKCFAGGERGGGAHLTPLGKKMAKTYRAMESKAELAMKTDWKVIQNSLKPID